MGTSLDSDHIRKLNVTIHDTVSTSLSRLYDGVARMRKRLLTSKGDYWIKQ